MLVNLDLLTFGGTVSTSLRAETMVDGLPRAYRFLGLRHGKTWLVVRSTPLVGVRFGNSRKNMIRRAVGCRVIPVQ